MSGCGAVDPPDELVDWCGLRVTRRSLDELQERLDRITELERQAWRESWLRVF